MKKNFFALAFAATFMLAACSESIIDDSNPNQVEKDETPVFTVSLADAAGTRVSMVQDGTVYKLNWEQDDAIAVSSSKDETVAWSKYLATPDADAPTSAILSFDSGETPVAKATLYKAFYPNTLVDNTTHAISLPASLDGIKPFLPMYAESETTTLSFNNLCSILQFNITTDAYLEAEVSLVSASKKISGTFTVDKDADDKYYLKPTTEEVIADADKKVTIINFVADNEGKAAVCFALPAGTYPAQDLGFQIKTSYGEKTFYLQQEITLQRGVIKSFNIPEIHFWQQIEYGSCKYVDTYMNRFDYLTAWKYKGNDNVFRISNQNGGYIYIQIDPSTNYVEYPDFYMGWNNTVEENVYARHPKNVTGLSVTHNKVLSYQDNGLPGIIQLAPYYVTESGTCAGDCSEMDYTILITFPGAAELYSAEVQSIDTDVNGNATAKINVSFGTGFSATVSCTTLPDVQPVNLDAAGVAQLALGHNLEVGTYQFTVAIYNSSNLIETLYLGNYYVNPNQWEYLYDGEYVYGNVDLGEYTSFPSTCPVMLFKSKSEDGRYLLKHSALRGNGVYFTLDTQTNLITVDQNQYVYDFATTTENGWEYLPVYIGEYKVHVPDDQGDSSYYDPQTDTYHFNLSYYAASQEFGHFTETLTSPVNP